MNEQTDSQLLEAYAQQGSEVAFRELVQRHLDLVYSAALRMVRDRQLAEDVSQGVFLALAKNARQLTHHPVLAGWLHRTAQNIAAQTVRSDVRRQRREQEAAAMNELLNASSENSWEKIAPHLDALVGELSEADRDAILLRYFQRKSAAEMGAVLGISDDAAQKRVNRAVERLREVFSKRGITTGTVGLATLVTANAVQAAPVGLAVTISAAALAGTAVTTSTLIAATTKTIAMTTLQKTVVTATVVVLAGAGIYEARQAAQLRDQVQTLQQPQAPLAAENQRLQTDLADATNRLARLIEEYAKNQKDNLELLRLRAEVTHLKTQGRSGVQLNQNDKEMASEVELWLSRVAKLKERLQQMPEQDIPELRFMSERAWMLSCQQLLDSQTDKDFTNAIRFAQGCAKNDFGKAMGAALQDYFSANPEVFPSDLAQLQPYFKGITDTRVFDRYIITRAELQIAVNPDSKTATQVYRMVGGASGKDADAQSEWVVMEKQPVYEGDVRLVVTKSGMRLQQFE